MHPGIFDGPKSTQPTQQKDSAAEPPRRYCGFRNGPAKRTRIGVHLHSGTDPLRRRIADPQWLRAASAIKTLPPWRVRWGSVWDPQMYTDIRRGTATDS